VQEKISRLELQLGVLSGAHSGPSLHQVFPSHPRPLELQLRQE
jgi:hypothetical protein